jgi:peroxiredoxin
MITKSFKLVSIAAACTLASGAWAAATVGQPAPAFTVQDVDGRTVSLTDFKGKPVVLEWVNPGCPFVRKHYDSANMQGTQKDAVAKGAVWLTINSTAAGSSDYKTPQAMGQWMRQQGAAATATLMDADGRVGRAYGARVTPHMYIIDAQGKLAYAGAIDSIPTARVGDIEKATNYVKQALPEVVAGKPATPATTQAYGCTIKYADG